MAVIINELEVVVEQPSAPKQEVDSAPAAAAPLTPQDLSDMNERRLRVNARLFAH